MGDQVGSEWLTGPRASITVKVLEAADRRRRRCQSRVLRAVEWTCDFVSIGQLSFSHFSWRIRLFRRDHVQRDMGYFLLPWPGSWGNNITPISFTIKLDFLFIISVP